MKKPDSGPACVCVGSDALYRRLFPKRKSRRDCVYLCEPVPNPRANWAAYSKDTEKSFVPVVEKSLGDGTILSWSTLASRHTHPTIIRTARRGRPTASRAHEGARRSSQERSAARANRSHEARRFVMQNEDVPWRQRSRSVPARVCSMAKADKPEVHRNAQEAPSADV